MHKKAKNCQKYDKTIKKSVKNIDNISNIIYN